MKLFCRVPGCNTSSFKRPDLKFFYFPTLRKRKALWLKKLNLPKNGSIRFIVCEKHFEIQHLTGYSSRRPLLKTAVPTLFLPGQDNDANTATSSDAHATSTKNQISKTLESTNPDESAKTEKDDFLRANQHDIDTALNNTTKGVSEFETQPLTASIEAPKRKYSEQFLTIALELFFRSPKPYRIYQRSFSLPKMSLLNSLCIPSTAGINRSILRALKAKVDCMTDLEKHCVLCVGTIPLTKDIAHDHNAETEDPSTKSATNGVIVMVRGLFHNWKQTVAFFFLNDCHKDQNIKLVIDEIINEMFRLGLNVRAYMTDLESLMVTYAEEKTISPKTPYIVVKNRIIYYMCDPLHLTKIVRDKLVNHNIEFINGLIAKWQYIKECYEHDCQKESLRLAPKLTAAHVNPVNGVIDDLKLTAEVFSRATAVAISTYVDLKLIDDDATHTMVWIMTMSKLLDMLNFSSVNPPDDKNAVFSGEKAQVEYLTMMCMEFLNMKKFSESQDVELFEAFSATIKALLLLYDDLSAENCWSPVVGLSLDCMDDFFFKVRTKYSMKPTVTQMTWSISNFPICNMFKYSLNRRSPNNLETFMAQVRHMADIDMYEPETAGS